LLWYDTPTLRNLVILDPKWVIDAATCFIRQHNLPDHTKNYQRMAMTLTIGRGARSRKHGICSPRAARHCSGR